VWRHRLIGQVVSTNPAWHEASMGGDDVSFAVRFVTGGIRRPPTAQGPTGVMSEAPQPTPEPRLTWRRRWTIRLVLTAAALVVMTYFAAANYVLVEVRLIVWQGDIRLSWALLSAVALGVVLGVIGRSLR
jgi:uncharacterized integral membrane protein